MIDIWNKADLKGELNKLEEKFFNVVQSIKTKSELDIARNLANEEIASLAKSNIKIGIVSLLSLAIIINLTINLIWLKFPIENQIIFMEVLLIWMFLLSIIYLFNSSKQDEKKELLFTLESIFDDGQLSLEAHQLCDESASANKWRKDAVRSRGDILVGDLLIMRKLIKFEEREKKVSVGLSKYQTLLTRD